MDRGDHRGRVNLPARGDADGDGVPGPGRAAARPSGPQCRASGGGRPGLRDSAGRDPSVVQGRGSCALNLPGPVPTPVVFNDRRSPRRWSMPRAGRAGGDERAIAEKSGGSSASAIRRSQAAQLRVRCASISGILRLSGHIRLSRVLSDAWTHRTTTSSNPRRGGEQVCCPQSCLGGGRWRLDGELPHGDRSSYAHRGAIAQLEEHLLCKQGVRSSSLLSSTTGQGHY